MILSACLETLTFGIKSSNTEDSGDDTALEPARPTKLIIIYIKQLSTKRGLQDGPF